MSKKLLLSLCVLVISLTMIGCSTESNDVPSLSATPIPDGNESRELDEEALMLELSECLRAEGMEITDPMVDSDGNIQRPELVEGTTATKQEWVEAYDACGSIIEGLTLKEEKSDVDVEFYIELATCMTEAGYDLEEPTVENFEDWRNDMKNNLDWEDSDVLAAYEECAGEGGGRGK